VETNPDWRHIYGATIRVRRSERSEKVFTFFHEQAEKPVYWRFPGEITIRSFWQFAIKDSSYIIGIWTIFYGRKYCII